MVCDDESVVDGVPVPSGTVTFFFTDIEGSTRLWDEHPDRMAEALEEHDRVVRDAMWASGGYVFATGGDGFCAAFSSADDAVSAAIAAQLVLAAGPVAGVELRVRMGLHSGVAQERDGDYFGPAVIRAARIMSVAHGGQVLVSAATRELMSRPSLEVRSLGAIELAGFAEREAVFQLSPKG